MSIKKQPTNLKFKTLFNVLPSPAIIILCSLVLIKLIQVISLSYHQYYDMYHRTIDAVFLSLALFTISLFLPSYAEPSDTFNGRFHPIRYKFGGETLISGLLLGWASIWTGNTGAVAVYANLFYGYILIRLMTSPFLPPVYSAAIIFILASQTFRFHHIGHEISFPMRDRVTMWGWGAIIWLLSLSIVIVLPFLIMTQIMIPSVWVFIASVLGILTVIAGIQYFRYFKANTLEKQKYFSIGIVLITQKMSGLDYRPPKHITITPTTTICLTGKLYLKKYQLGNKYQTFITPKQFIYREYFWQVYNIGDWQGWSNIAKLSATKPIDYIYQVNDSKEAYRPSILTQLKLKFWKLLDELGDDFSKYVGSSTRIHIVRRINALKNLKESIRKNIYSLTDSHHQAIWTATSFYKTKFPDYTSDLLKLFNPLQLPTIDIKNDFAEIKAEQKFIKHDEIHFHLIENIENVIELEGELFQMSDYALTNYSIWHSQDYLIIAPNELIFREWNKLILFRKNPLIPIKTFAWIDSEQSFRWDETLIKNYQLTEQSYDERNKALINHPNGLVITSLHFGFVKKNTQAPIDIFYGTQCTNMDNKTSIIIETSAGIFPAI